MFELTLFNTHRYYPFFVKRHLRGIFQIWKKPAEIHEPKTKNRQKTGNPKNSIFFSLFFYIIMK